MARLGATSLHVVVAWAAILCGSDSVAQTPAPDKTSDHDHSAIADGIAAARRLLDGGPMTLTCDSGSVSERFSFRLRLTIKTEPDETSEDYLVMRNGATSGAITKSRG